LHPDSHSRGLNWRTRDLSPATPRRNRQLLRARRKVHFSTTNDAWSFHSTY
jgi:macrodomain Ter protein organizer (MatP/YcbG family)